MPASKTVIQSRFPRTPEFSRIAKQWKLDYARLLLGFIWQGYDLLLSEVLNQVNTNEADDDLERSITELLEPRIRGQMSGLEPFFLQHESFEYATKKPSPAQPPTYDMAFILRQFPQVKWPLESKLLRKDSQIAEYVKAVKNNYLKCRYSPYSSEAAMLGFLLKGSPETAFEQIAKALKTKLKTYKYFKARNHRVSNHRRKPPAKKSFVVKFRCHHLVMQLQISSQQSLSPTGKK